MVSGYKSDIQPKNLLFQMKEFYVVIIFNLILYAGYNGITEYWIICIEGSLLRTSR